MKVTTGGVAGLSLFLWLQLTESTSETSNSEQKLDLLAWARTGLNMASLRSTLGRRPLYSSRARRELSGQYVGWMTLALCHSERCSREEPAFGQSQRCFRQKADYVLRSE